MAQCRVCRSVSLYNQSKCVPSPRVLLDNGQNVGLGLRQAHGMVGGGLAGFALSLVGGRVGGGLLGEL